MRKMHARMKAKELGEEEKEPKLDLSPKMKKRDDKLEHKLGEMVKHEINVKPEAIRPKQGLFAKRLFNEKSNDHKRAAKNSKKSSSKAGETITLTFHDCAEKYVGTE